MGARVGDSPSWRVHICLPPLSLSLSCACSSCPSSHELVDALPPAGGALLPEAHLALAAADGEHVAGQAPREPPDRLGEELAGR